MRTVTRIETIITYCLFFLLSAACSWCPSSLNTTRSPRRRSPQREPPRCQSWVPHSPRPTPQGQSESFVASRLKALRLKIYLHMLDVSLSTGWPAVPDTLVVFPGLCATPPSLRPSPSPSRPVCAPARRTTATSLASGTARPQRPTSTSTPLSLSISTWVLS